MFSNHLFRHHYRWVVLEILFFLLSNNLIQCLPFLASFLIFTKRFFFIHTHACAHMHSLIYSFSQAHTALLFQPLCSINLPHLSIALATGANGVKTIFCESERCFVFPISYSWALLAQVCIPGLVCSGDTVADWMWINESVTFNTGRWCSWKTGRGMASKIGWLFISSID